MSTPKGVSAKYVDMHATAANLLSLRTNKGWAASYLAEIAGVQEAVVHRAEKGSFSIINLNRIVRALGCGVEAVLVWKGGEG